MQRQRMVTAAVAAGLAARAALAANYTWTGSGANALWTTTANWSPSANYPQSSDTAYFGDGGVGKAVEAVYNKYPNALYVTNAAGVHVVNVKNVNNGFFVGNPLYVGSSVGCAHLLVTNGIFRTGNNVTRIGYADATNPFRSGRLTIGAANGGITRFNTRYLYQQSLNVGVGPLADGTLDLTQATAMNDAATSTNLQFAALTVGSGSNAVGQVLLPSASDRCRGVLLNKGAVVAAVNHYIGYSGGTGTVGSAANPWQMPDGIALYATTNAYTSSVNLYIGVGNKGVPGSYGRLAPGNNSKVGLVLGTLQVGYGHQEDVLSRMSDGVLDLRSAAIDYAGTVCAGSTVVGGMNGRGSLLFATEGAARLKKLHVTTQLSIGAGSHRFQRGAHGRIGSGADGSGAMPDGVDYVFGAGGAPAGIAVGTEGTWRVAAPADGRIVAGAGSRVGGAVGNLFCGTTGGNSNECHGVADFAQAAIAEGGLSIGALAIGCASNNKDDYTHGRGAGILRLGRSGSTNVVVVVPNVRIGTTQASATLTGLLETFGTIVRFTGDGTGNNLLRVQRTGTVTNHVSGSSSGLDIVSTSPGVVAVDEGGRVVVAFDGDPALKPGDWFFGLKWAGNQLAVLAALNNSGADGVPNTADDKLQYTVAGLSPAWRPKVALSYDPTTAATYLGFQTRSAGTAILLR